MDVQLISREYAFSESPLALPTSRQDISVFQFDSLTGMISRPSSTGHNNNTTIVAKRGRSQPPHLLWSLPRKRSNQTLTSEGVGDPEEFHAKAISGVYSAKRWKGPVIVPLTNPLSSCKSVVTTGIPWPLLDFPEAKTVSPKRADFAEGTGDQLDYDRPRTLRSPFEYTQKLATSQVDPAAKNEIQRFDSNRSVHSKNSSVYTYHAPTIPSDNVNQTSDTHRRVPCRQLSYGDPPSKSGPRSLHRTTGSWELRQEAERHAEECNLNSLLDSTLHAPAARPCHFEPTRCKPRLWLDLTEQRDGIQEAHAITIRPSRSKPRVVSTPRRRATINPSETTPVCPDRGLSIPYPHTPPPTPASSESLVDLAKESAVDRKYDVAYERIKARQTCFGGVSSVASLLLGLSTPTDELLLTD